MKNFINVILSNNFLVSCNIFFLILIHFPPPLQLEAVPAVAAPVLVLALRVAVEAEVAAAAPQQLVGGVAVPANPLLLFSCSDSRLLTTSCTRSVLLQWRWRLHHFERRNLGDVLFGGGFLRILVLLSGCLWLLN